MDLARVIEILKKNDLNKVLYFTRKMRNKYISYSPEVNQKILNELSTFTINYLSNYLDFDCIDFNPTGYRDGTIEECNVDYVGNFEEVIESFDDGNIEDLENQVENFNFYCIAVQDDDENKIYLFRRVTKFKRLYSKGILAAFQGNQLNKINSKILGIDGEIDLIVYNDEILTLNHIALERIFRLEDQFSTKAQEVIDCIRKSNRIVNFDEFEEDCLSDLRLRKTLTKMLNEGNELSRCFDNFDNIIETINIFELEIEVQKSPTESIIYEDKKQVRDILLLIRDSYYRSLIGEKHGIDNKI